MKNILKEKPGGELHGRLRYSMKFIDEKDIKDKRVLDVGCGFGWFELGALKKNVKEIVGTELTDGDLETARRFIKDSRVIFKVGDATDLPFPNNSFDTVISWEVIEHLPKKNENKMFKEVYRVLKKNGAFYLSTPNSPLVCKLFDPAWWLIGHRHYSTSDLCSFAKSNNFSVEKITIRGRFWEIVGINDLYLNKWVLRKTSVMKKLVDFKQDKEYKKEGFTTIFMKFKKNL